MPANLPPEYYKAEKWFKTAAASEEKILAIEQMLRVMPKHKGTDHIRADLRRRLSKLRQAPPKKGTKQVDIFHIPPAGAGQIALIGTPNCGKSALVAALTNAKVNVAEFPFATHGPVPGMLQFEDVQIQLIDMPPVTEEFTAPGQVGTYRNCNLITIVLDLTGDIEHQFRVVLDFLDERSLLIDRRTAARDENGNVIGKRAFCIGTKTDLASHNAGEKFRQFCRDRFESTTVSAETGIGVEKLPLLFFKLLDIIRIYTKPPGRQADLEEPFTLPAGSTVLDLAVAIHRELAEKLKFARIWGTGVYNGQNAKRDHVLHDKDIIELHFA